MSERDIVKNSQPKKEKQVSPKQKHINNNSPINHVLQLQRTIGNQAVQRMFKSGAIQAKLKINQPNDPYEQEADRVAEQVMRMPDSQLQRACLCGGGCPKCQTEQPDHEHECLQTSETGQIATPPIVQDVLAASGQPLDLATRGFMEPLFGHNFSRVCIHADSDAADAALSVSARAYTFGSHIVFGSGQYAPAKTEGRRLLAHELTHVVQQRGQTGQPIQRKPNPAPPTVKYTFNVTVNEQISGPEFMIRAVMQFRSVTRAEAEKLIRDKNITCSHTVCSTGVTADLVGKPIAVSVETGGFTKEENSAAAKRTAAIGALPAEERGQINDETDRRFWNRTEYKRGQPLDNKNPAEKGMRQLWLREREGVIQDQESVDRLPARVKEFINPEGTRKIRPEDYKAVLRIAKRLESFSEADWLLYQRRINASTDDYERVENSLARFQEQQTGEKKTMDRLQGVESLYQKVKAYKALEVRMYTPSLKTESMPIDFPCNKERLQAEKAALDKALAAANFSSVQEFDLACASFLDLFRKRAVELTLLVLKGSEKVVFAERKRYENAAENANLFVQLAPVRTAVNESHKAFSEAMPTPIQLKTESFRQTPSQQAATTRYIETSQRADSERKKLEERNPILKDSRLPNAALNVKDGDTLGEVLRSNAEDRLADIQKTRLNVQEKKDFIFKLDRIVEMTRQELGVAPNSIYDELLNDYKSNIAFREVVLSAATAALAIGLGLLSFGGGTIAVLAAGAGLGLSIYQAGDEYEKYSSARAAAGTSFDKALIVSSEEPSAVWVAVALIGVGFDGASLVSAFKAAVRAARVLQATGDVGKFEAELAKATELSNAVKKSLNRAAQAEKEYQTAAEELAKALRDSLGRAYMGIDPNVIFKVTKAAYYEAKKGITDFDVFLREFNLQKFAKNIDVNNLTTEQSNALRNAFNTGCNQFAADAAKTAFTVKVPYKSGERIVTFDDVGKMLLDGKSINKQEYVEIFKKLKLTHVIQGHGPNKNLNDVINEARLVDNSHPGLSGKFTSDRSLLDAVERAKAAYQAKPERMKHVDLLPNEGRAFARRDQVPSGSQVLPPSPEMPADIVEIVVQSARAIFDKDGSLVTIYPIGLRP